MKEYIEPLKLRTKIFYVGIGIFLILVFWFMFFPALLPFGVIGVGLIWSTLNKPTEKN